jgi:serine/threonine-protein kinase
LDRPDDARKPNLGDQAAKLRAGALLGVIVSGRYRIVELLAMGGVGAVYLAEHVHMHKHVAVKVLHPDPHGLPDLVPRFEREAVAGAHIQHPNVAAATDFGKLDDGSSFLVLEYVRGTTLRDVIRRGPMPAERVGRIAKQIASGLGAAHAMGIVHRDVKPRNVMLIEGERDVVKIIDFGLAKLALKEVSAVAASRNSYDEERITTSGQVFGTIAYLAPEAALGMDTVDARADLYALGIVLYEMLAGKHPFDLGDPVALFRHHHQVKPPPIAQRAPGVVVPPALEAVVMKLLEKSKDARFPDAEAVVAALDAALDLSPSSGAPLQLGEGAPVYPGPSILPPPVWESPPAAPSPSGEQSESAKAAVASVSPPVSMTMGGDPPNPPPLALRAPVAPAATVSAPSRQARRWPWAVALGVVALGVIVATAASRSGDKSEVDPGTAGARVASSPPSSTSRDVVEASTTATTAGSAAGAPSPARAGDAAAARLRLRTAAGMRDWAHAAEAFLALVDSDPSACQDPVLVGPIRDLASALALPGGEAADRVFDALAHRGGSAGLDILYELVSKRGGSKASARALELLTKSDVIAQATPELRITVALRTTSCDEMPALLPRAAAEGDGRTLIVMQTIGSVCLGRSPALDDAQKTLIKRLRGR